MFRTLTNFLILAALGALPATAAAQKVTLPTTVKATSSLVFIKAETDCQELKWVSMDGAELIPPELLKDSRIAVMQRPATAGVYRVLAYGAKGDKASEPAVCAVIVGDAPVPPGPTPPVPPGPVPPTPVPPTPVPVAGFRVILVYEATDGALSLTKEQLNILYSTQIRTYLDRKCVKDDNRPGWRMWDKDVVLTEKESATWKALWAATKPQVKTVPSVVIVNDSKGEVFPLPATEAEFLSTLTKAEEDQQCQRQGGYGGIREADV